MRRAAHATARAWRGAAWRRCCARRRAHTPTARPPAPASRRPPSRTPRPPCQPLTARRPSQWAHSLAGRTASALAHWHTPGSGRPDPKEQEEGERYSHHCAATSHSAAHSCGRGTVAISRVSSCVCCVPVPSRASCSARAATSGALRVCRLRAAWSLARGAAACCLAARFLCSLRCRGVLGSWVLACVGDLLRRLGQVGPCAFACVLVEDGDALHVTRMGGSWTMKGVVRRCAAGQTEDRWPPSLHC
jgi:hypothetical protein